MSRYEKSYRHINSQCENKTVFFLCVCALLEEKESDWERERERDTPLRSEDN